MSGDAMLIPILISAIVVLGIVFYYQWFLAPRLNPRNRAEQYESQNMIPEAIVEYNKILERDSRDFRAHYKLAELFFRQGQVSEAISHYEEILSINRFDQNISKLDILKRISDFYQESGDIQKAFQSYFDILKQNPNDLQCLYQVAFIFLGQEMFDMALKYFERLIAGDKVTFEILFGAGIAALQAQKSVDAVKYFKDALVKDPHSDIGNLAMAFALQKKRDYKAAVNYLKVVIDGTKDPNASFIARRLLGIILVQAKQAGGAVKVFEELLEFAKSNAMDDDVPAILYDLGFAAVKGEKTSVAYDYWNQLYQIDRNFKDIKRLITTLRKEMDTESQKRDPSDESVLDYVETWIKNSFSENYIWEICGLKSEQKIDMRNITVTTRVSQGKTDAGTDVDNVVVPESIEHFNNLDVENFRIIANRIVQKLGYSVDEIMTTYRENDGVDFMAHTVIDKKKTLVWVRRWRGINVGEIPLRNFAQAINDTKSKAGLFITTTPLTPSAEQSLAHLTKITLITPEQVGDLLSGLV